MKKKEQYTIVVTPKLEVECKFNEEYELLAQAQYRNNIPPYERVNIKGNSKTKLCALCDQEEPHVSFSKEAHLLPASLGNNKYFSSEECDDCNGKYGEYLENELAQMFGLQRSIAGVKGRNIPKIKFHTGETIGFNREKNTAEIVSKEQGKIAIERADGEVNITVDMPKYKPHGAILSIMKSAWLLLNSTSRAKYPLIKQLIKGEAQDNAVSFFSMFCPGNGKQFTSLNIYELKDKTKELPPIIIQFNFLNRVIFWHHPIEGKLRREVFPEVHFPFHESKANVTMNGYKISDPNTEWGGKENLKLKYDRIEEFNEKDGLPTNATKYEPIEHPQTDVLIRLGSFEIISRLTILRFDNEANEFVFEGKELGGKLWFFENKLFKKQQVSFQMNLGKVPLEFALKTVDFLEKAGAHSGKIEFLINDSIFFVAYDAKFNMNLNFNSLRDGIKYLTIINKEFGQNLRYPAQLSQQEFKNIKHLACAIKYGSFKESSDYLDKFEITCDPELLKVLETNKDENLSFSMQGQKNFSFLGKSFGPFKFEFALEAPKIESRSASTNGLCDFVLLAKNFIQSYPQWVKEEKE